MVPVSTSGCHGLQHNFILNNIQIITLHIQISDQEVKENRNAKEERRVVDEEIVEQEHNINHICNMIFYSHSDKHQCD